LGPGKDGIRVAFAMGRHDATLTEGEETTQACLGGGNREVQEGSSVVVRRKHEKGGRSPLHSGKMQFRSFFLFGGRKRPSPCYRRRPCIVTSGFQRGKRRRALRTWIPGRKKGREGTGIFTEPAWIKGGKGNRLRRIGRKGRGEKGERGGDYSSMGRKKGIS